MRAAVQFQNPIVEVLDTQAEPGDPHLPDRGELRLRQGSRLALESNFLSPGPGRRCGQAVDQPCELRSREKRRSAPAEVDEIDRSCGDRLQWSIEFPLASEPIEIGLYLAGVSIRVNTEITKLAALPTERNVQIKAERDSWD